jgi:histidine triad (HIT) family protein
LQPRLNPSTGIIQVKTAAILDISLMINLARSTVGRHLLGWIFGRMSFLIPVQRLRETATLIAFNHPQPAYLVHILIVPKRAIPGLADLTPKDQDFMTDLFNCVQSLVAELELDANGYRLIANGGRYQDVPQLHFHLVSGDALA